MERSEADVRIAVERELGGPLTDEQWRVLVESGDVGVVRNGAMTISAFVRQVRKMIEAFAGASTLGTRPVRARLRAHITPTPVEDTFAFSRQDAVCVAVASLAANDPEVVTFRLEVLGDTLLTYALDSRREGVEEWIPRQLERERPLLEACPGDPPRLTYFRFLGHGVETSPVAPGGVLDHLRQLGDRLATRYLWTPPAAVGFALTGDVTPTIDLLRVTIQPNHTVPGLARITLTVDPAATPEAVASAYQQTRARITKKGARELWPKTLLLAAFAAERPPREPIATQMAAWNHTAPDSDWHYKPKQAANFVRDRNFALARLIRPAYQLPDQEESFTYDNLIS